MITGFIRTRRFVARETFNASGAAMDAMDVVDTMDPRGGARCGNGQSPPPKKGFSASALLLLTALFALTSFAARAADPFHEAGRRLIHFEAKLTKQDGTVLPDAAHVLVFRLYEFPVGGDPLWTEVQSGVQSQGGYINVVLGSITPFDSAQAFAPDTTTADGKKQDWKKYWSTFEKPLYVGVTVDLDGLPLNDPAPPNNQATPPQSGLESELLPRQQVLPAHFAMDAYGAKYADALSHQPPVVRLAPRGAAFWLDPVTLDATPSISPRGEALEFAFDTEGDGLKVTPSPVTFDPAFAPGAVGAAFTPGGAAAEPIPYLANVYAKDAKGLIGSATQLLPRRVWKDIKGATGPAKYNGDDCSLAVIDGRPAVAFHAWDASTGRGHLKFAIADNADGGGDWAVQTLDPEAAGVDKGLFPSLAALSSGAPAVAYYDKTGGDLKYVGSTLTLGSGQSPVWGTPHIVEDGTQAPGSGLYASMAVVNGNPAIAYYGGVAKRLKYRRATSAAPASAGNWGTTALVDPPSGDPSTDDRGTFCSLAVVGGFPAIAYHDATKGTLKFTRGSDSAGSAWTTITVDNGNGAVVGTQAALKVLQTSPAKPAIAYMQTTGDATGGVASFGSPERIYNRPTLGYRLGGFTSGDVDLDGDVDVVFADVLQKNIILMENPGDGLGSWNISLIRAIAESPSELRLSDLDSDGDLDCVATAGGSGTNGLRAFINPKLGGGGSVFTAWPTEVLLPGTSAFGHDMLVVDDVDGDGLPDVICANTHPNNYDVFWCRNQGGGTSWSSPNYLETNADLASFGLAFADVTGDSKKDVVLSTGIRDEPGFLDQHVYVYTHLTPTTFSGRTTISDNLGYRGITHTADIDGDDDQDIVAGAHASASAGLYWFRNNAGNFGLNVTQTIITPAKNVYFFSLGDLDKDSDPDVAAIIYEGPTGRASWFENEGGGASWTEHPLSLLPSFTNAWDIQIADINGDTNLDIIAYDEQASDGTNGGEIVWWKNTMSPAAAGFPERVDIPLSDAGQSRSVVSAAGDIDNDGDQDLAISFYWYDGVISHGQIRLFENLDGLGKQWTERLIWNSDVYSTYLALGHINGDSYLDIAVTTHNGTGTSTPNLTRWLANPGGAGTWTDHAFYDPPGENEAIVIADVDKDGLNDIITENGIPSGSNALWFKNNGGGSSWTTRDIPNLGGGTGTGNITDIRSVDLDGDGNNDWLGLSRITPTVSVEWYRSLNAAGTSYDSKRTIHSFSAVSVYQLDTGDVDRDGKIDILVADISRFFWLRNPGGSSVPWGPERPIATLGGNFAWEIEAEDIDGDGDLDAFISGAGGPSWAENQDGTGASWEVRPLGGQQGPSDYMTSLAVADFDGNGSKDVSGFVNGPNKLSWWPQVNSGSYIKFVTASDSLGSAWGTSVKLDGGEAVGLGLSLGVNGGKPALAYYDAPNGNLKYAKDTSTAGDGSGPWEFKVIDGQDNTGGQPSLREINGRPAVVYQDVTRESLKYATFPPTWPGE